MLRPELFLLQFMVELVNILTEGKLLCRVWLSGKITNSSYWLRVVLHIHHVSFCNLLLPVFHPVE